MKQDKNTKQQQEQSDSDQSTKEQEVDYKDKYLRSLADYQNLIKRTQKEKQDAIQFANEVFVEKLLPVLDHLERAKGHVEDEGVGLIYKELSRVLEEIGVETINVDKTEEFNPEYMECIEAEKDGKMLEITRAGYRYKDKVIRPVQVKVVK